MKSRYQLGQVRQMRRMLTNVSCTRHSARQSDNRPFFNALVICLTKSLKNKPKNISVMQRYAECRIQRGSQELRSFQEAKSTFCLGLAFIAG